MYDYATIIRDHVYDYTSDYTHDYARLCAIMPFDYSGLHSDGVQGPESS
jgi:hypothetical protein